MMGSVYAAAKVEMQPQTSSSLTDDLLFQDDHDLGVPEDAPDAGISPTHDHDDLPASSADELCFQTDLEEDCRPQGATASVAETVRDIEDRSGLLGGRHAFPLFGWDSTTSLPNISSALSNSPSEDGAGMRRTRCISAQDSLNTLASEQARGGAARSQPVAISVRGSAGGSHASIVAAKGDDDDCCDAQRSAAIDVGRPGVVGVSHMSLPMHARMRRCKTSEHDNTTYAGDVPLSGLLGLPFRPPHEMVSLPHGHGCDMALEKMAHSAVHSHSLTRHRTTADRLRSVVFEQTGFVPTSGF